MASAIRAGLAYVELQLRNSGFVKGLRSAEKSLARSAAKMRKLGANILAFGGALSTPFFAALVQASRMEETMQKFNVVFGDASMAVKEWSDDFAGSVGRSRQQIADFMASSQDLFVPLGFDEKKAEELSKIVTGLAVDLGSFNNKEDALVQRDLQAALTGSGEVMKKYGVILSEAAVKAQLLREGIDPKTATDQQKVQSRLNIILKGTTNAQGDAIRSAGSLANSWKRLQGSIANFFESVGRPLLGIAADIVNRVSGIVGITGKWIEANQGLVKIGAVVVAGIIGLGGAIFTLGIGASILSVALGGVATILAFLTTPIGAVLVGIGVLSGAVYGLAKLFPEAFSSIGSMFGDFGNHALDVLKGIAGFLVNGEIAAAGSLAFTALVNTAAGSLDSLLNSFKATFSNIVTVVQLAMKAAVSTALAGVGVIIKAGVDASKALGTLTDEEAFFIKKGVDAGLAKQGQQAGIFIDAAGAGINAGFARIQNGIAELEARTADELAQKLGLGKDKFDEFLAKAKEIGKFDLKGFDIPKLENAIAGGQGKVSSLGTFSGAAVARLGGGGVQQKMLTEQQRQSALIKQSNDKAAARDKLRDDILKKKQKTKKREVV